MKGISILTIGTIALVGLLTQTSYAEEYIEYDYLSIPSVLTIPSDTNLIITNDDTKNSHRMMSGIFDTGNFHYGGSVTLVLWEESGTHNWYDPITGHEGTIIIDGSAPAPQVSQPVQQTPVETTVDDSYESISEQTKAFKQAIQDKIDAKIAPLESKITQLENSNNQLIITNDQISATNEQLKSEVSALQVKVSEFDAVIDQIQKDADNWKAIAMEQIKVMTEVLSLF